MCIAIHDIHIESVLYPPHRTSLGVGASEKGAGEASRLAVSSAVHTTV